MARKKKLEYKFVPSMGLYRKREKGVNDGKPVYGKTPEELDEKLAYLRKEAAAGIDSRNNPTVEQYVERWMQLHGQYVRTQTANDYEYIIRRFIVPTIGQLKMRDVVADDILEALLSASNMSRSVYNKVDMILKMVFEAAAESNVITRSPCPKYRKGGKPPKAKESLTNEQVEILLDAVKGTVAEVFVNLAVFTGMRREEICALKWDRVFLDAEDPFVRVNRTLTWLDNKPVLADEPKSDSAERDIPLPDSLTALLRTVKDQKRSEFVLCNSTGGVLTQTQYRNMWHAVVCRTVQERTYTKYYPDGRKEKVTVTPKLGEKAPHRKYCDTIDFSVHPHKIRRTYITRLILSGVDPKTGQYLAGHKNSKITMDIYAQVMYNTPKDTAQKVKSAFGEAAGGSRNILTRDTGIVW